MIGMMRYLPDGGQMKEADTYTIRTLGVPSMVLMERAALKTVEVMEQSGIDLERALIACGSGNNGGDGFAIARLLHEKKMHPEILFAGREQSLTEECRCQKEIDERLGIPVFTEVPDREYTVIIDAVFGVGLSREITGHYRSLIDQLNGMKGRKVAVDIPSGVSSRTGQILGTAFQAELTVSMACVKLGCELFPGKEMAGRTVPVPIGIDPGFFDDRNDVCFTLERECLPSLLPERKADSNKGTYGRLLMITGSAGMAGAAYLSAMAAYTAGAGLVRIYTSEDNRVILQQLLPEAVITCYKEHDEEEIRELLDWADTVCIGCGLGQSDTSEQILLSVMKYIKTPCVADADALNLMSRHMELFGNMETPLILTPHMMEMSRLTGKSVGEIKADRVGAAEMFAAEYPVICVLKDSRTAVSCRGRNTFVNLAGNSAMAKAGSGDVLAGVIAGLMAQGKEPFDAACLGVFLHACGGDEAREAEGAYSVLARDLITGIRQCMKKYQGEN